MVSGFRVPMRSLCNAAVCVATECVVHLLHHLQLDETCPIPTYMYRLVIYTYMYIDIDTVSRQIIEYRMYE